MIYVDNNCLDPFFNFALEYYLLKEYDLGEDVFLFWRTEPALMIGRYQNTLEEINRDYIKKKKIHVVRRITGGGTIYTDLNGWQFSFIIRNKNYREINFKIYTDPIIDALAALGINAYFNNRNDILISGKKISGNAQYSDENGVLHHGSLLFNTDISEMEKSITVSDDKIISKGIKSVRERVANISDFLDKQVDSLEFKKLILNHLKKNIAGTYSLTAKDISRVHELAYIKFRRWDWNYGASPDCNIIKSNRFKGGKIQFNLNIHNGYIEQCKIYGDFFCRGEVEVVSQSLIGCVYKEDEVKNILEHIKAQSLFYDIDINELMSCII